MLSRARLRDSRGVTLIELVVAMAMSTVVVFGASALIITSINVNAQVTGRVSALQEARTGLETLLQQLNSGCLVNDVSPMQATTASNISPAVNSDASDLVFVSGINDSASLTPVEHVVSISSSGALIDTSYPGTGGSPPALGTPATWTFSPSGSTAVLMENVSRASQPPFQYFSYSNPSNPTANSLQNAAALATPLSASNAAAVADVDIDLRVNPPGHSVNSTESSEFQDSAVFRLTAATSQGTNYPCD